MKLRTDSFVLSMVWGAVTGALASVLVAADVSSVELQSVEFYRYVALLGACPGALAGGSVEGMRRLYRSAFPDREDRSHPIIGGVLGLLGGGAIGIGYGLACVGLYSASLGPDPSKLAGLAVMIYFLVPTICGSMVGLLLGVITGLGLRTQARPAPPFTS